MTDFMDAVRRTLEGIDHFSVGPCDEGAFGKCPCESCGSTLAGNRYDAHGLIDGELCHFSVCVDCLFYHANGEAA